MEEKIKLVVVVALFNPQIDEFKTVSKYAHAVDLCILMDDSESNNELYARKVLGKLGVSNYLYYWNEKNIGLCSSINKGIKKAIELSADWILLLDQDSEIDGKVVFTLKKYIKNNDMSSISCIVPQYNYDRHKRVPYEGVKKIKWSNMSGMCVNQLLFEEVGYFDERLFIDGLDIDWGIRARKKGYLILEIGNAVMDHHPAETREFILFKRALFLYGWSSPERYYYQFRANHYMIKKYWSLEALKWQIIKTVKVLLLFDDKREYIKVFFKAINDCNQNVWGKYKENS